MGMIQRVKGRFNTLFNKQVQEVFGVKVIDSSTMASFVKRCVDVYKGNPNAAFAGRGAPDFPRKEVESNLRIV